MKLKHYLAKGVSAEKQDEAPASGYSGAKFPAHPNPFREVRTVLLLGLGASSPFSSLAVTPES